MIYQPKTESECTVKGIHPMSVKQGARECALVQICVAGLVHNTLSIKANMSISIHTRRVKIVCLFINRLIFFNSADKHASGTQR